MKIANGTVGNFSNSAVWDSVTNTPTLHASTNITVSTSNLFTQTFTAPNTTNACTGVLLYVGNVGTGGTITVALQESTVDKVSQTIAATALTLGWVYIHFATPYVFTTTAASAYRFRIVNAGATGTTLLAADSGAANIAYQATDNRNVVPTTTEDFYAVAPNQGSIFTLTIDGTQTSGSGGITGQITTGRSLTIGMYVGYNATVAFDVTASSQLTIKGNIYIDTNGVFSIGTALAPVLLANTATLIFNENAVDSNYGIVVAALGSFLTQGAVKTSTSLWKTTLASGVGTVVSPLLTTDSVAWSVGDEILVCAASNTATNYNETESRFVITVNSPTSYVLSATSGGVAAALSFTHAAGADIVNVQRNVLIKTTDTTKGWFLINNSTLTGGVSIEWARLNTIGAGQLLLANNIGTVQAVCDYTVCYSPTAIGFVWNNTAIPQTTYTGLVSYNSTSGTSAAGSLFDIGSSNLTFIDCFAISCRRYGIWVKGSNNAFTRLRVSASNITGFAGASGLFLQGGNFNSFSACTVDCSNVEGVILTSSANTFSSCTFGGKGSNVIDIFCATGAYNQAVFTNCTFSSPTIVGSYLLQAAGSVIAFHNLTGTNYNHRWYTKYGVAYATGAGLSDTNVRTSGTYNIRLSPENQAIGFTFSYYKAVNVGEAISALGFIQLNAALTADVSSSCVVNLYLPGNTATGATPDATVTMSKLTNTYNPYVLGANYVGSVPGLARIDIVVKGLANEYAYIADLDNGSNLYTNFKIWNNGQPSQIMVETAGDAVAMWSTAISSLTATGSIGAKLKNALTLGQFIGLK